MDRRAQRHRRCVRVPVAVRQAFSRRRAKSKQSSTPRRLERRGGTGGRAGHTPIEGPPRSIHACWQMSGTREQRSTDSQHKSSNESQPRPTHHAVDTGIDSPGNERLASPHGLTARMVVVLEARHDPCRSASNCRRRRMCPLKRSATRRSVPRPRIARSPVGPRRPLDDPLRRGDGRVAPLLRDELRYSTPELLAIEQRIVDMALHNGPLRVGLAAADWVEAAVGRRPFLSAEQAQMVRRLTGEGGQIVAVVGKAGTGKTTALSAAREAWVASGLNVVGVAVARRAARELQDSAENTEYSLAALLLELRRGGRFALAPGTVVVLDEASMVSSRDLGELVEHVVNAGGKLVLCGDHRQLPSIRAGGAFRAIVARTDAIELTHNRRQQEQWERDALDTLREGVASKAIRVYEAHERLVIGGDRDALMERLVSDWWVAGRPDHTAMIALRRADVRRLNGQARALMRDAGMLGPDVPFRCGTFAIGDRVVVRRNDRRLGTANGETGLVEAVDDRAGISVRVGERRVQLRLPYLDSSPSRPTVQHAYAITGHIAQGMTVERAFVLGSPDMYREWGYTAMSRGRCENRLYVVAPDDLERQEIAPADRRLPSARDSLEHALSTSRAHTVALDTGLRQDVRAASTGELSRRLNALRRSVPDTTVAAALKAHAAAVAELERLARELHAAQRRQTQLDLSRPSLLRARKLFRHHALLEATAADCHDLADIVSRQDDAVSELMSRIDACRAEQAQRELPTRGERELIEEELKRRASIERSVSSEHLRDAARRTNPTAEVRRSSARSVGSRR